MQTIRTCISLIAATGIFLLAPATPSFSQTFTKITTGSPVTEAGAWRSVNWVDYDRDGDLDLFVTRGLSGGQNNVLFRNEGGPGFSFTRMSALQISLDQRSSDGSTWADYDNDGYPDAFAVNWYNQNNLLYHNNGNGTFTRILTGPTVNDGGYSETASWGDYNNDGLVDLYVANSSGPRLNFLYRNTGNGQFVKITAGAQSQDVAVSRGVNWVDYDNDGDQDLFVANEVNGNENLYRNMLMETGADTFQRVTTGPLVSSGGSSWSGSWGDYDNDGDQDVFVVNWTNQASRLYVNNGDGTFGADSAGPLATDIGYGASAGWGDMDNDGDLDLIVTHAYSGGAAVNYLYRNLLAETDTARFERILAGPVVTDPGFMYGNAWGDFDGDGDLDLFVARTLAENQVNAFYSNDGNSNHWLTLDLRGTVSNAAALGAKVRVKAVMGGSPAWLTRVVEGQSGYCGQNLQLHFGLRDAATVDSLVIRWPSGFDEIFTGVAADRHLVVTENDSTPIVPVWPAQGYLNDSPEITLRWGRPLYYPPYRVQVATDSTFGGGVIADTIVGGDTTTLIKILSNFTRYYWRVRPARSIHDSMWSDIRNFDNAVQVPGATAPLNPADYSVDVPTSTILRWSAAVRATGYRLRLGTDSLFGTTMFDTTIADTAFSTGILPFLTGFYWDVQGVNFVGAGPVSPRSGFTTIIQAPVTPLLHGPAEGENDVGVPVTLTWLAVARAAAYEVQLSPESLFVPPWIRDTVVTDTSLTAEGLGSFTTYYWRVRSLNAGGLSIYSAFNRFRTILAAPVPTAPVRGSSQFSSVSFIWEASPPATIYHLQCGPDSGFPSVAFEDSMIAGTSIAVFSLQTDTTLYWRVRARHPESTSPWSPAGFFVTTPDTFSITTTSAWNLVSLPGFVTDRSGTAVFPGALTPFYRYDSAYIETDTLEYGAGYWVRLPPGSTVHVAGTKRFGDTIDVRAGWNLIAALSEGVAASSIATVPGGLSSSAVFGYDGGFYREDTLRPGRAYWIRLEEPGKLVLDTSPMAAVATRIRIRPEDIEPPSPPGSPVAGPPAVPASASLSRNYPNPFNPVTTVRFQLPSDGDVRLEIFTALGERAAVLVDGFQEAGYHSVEWNAAAFPSGTYYLRMIAGDYHATGRMLLVK